MTSRPEILLQLIVKLLCRGIKMSGNFRMLLEQVISFAYVSIQIIKCLADNPATQQL